MPLPVEMPIAGVLLDAVPPGGNDGLDLALLQPGERVAIPAMSGIAWVISATWPGVRIKRIGNPNASVSAWILLPTLHGVPARKP